jgi:hypothetical protein
MLRSGVVWYNHSKLKALRAKAAQQDGKCDEDLEQPLLQNRTKADILGDIQRLQREMDLLSTWRAGGLNKLKAGGSSPHTSAVRINAGGDSSGSSTPGAGAVRGEEQQRAMSAHSGFAHSRHRP